MGVTMEPKKKRKGPYDNSLRRLPSLARFWLRSNYNLYVRRIAPIIVYQMGGVGSNSVHEELEAHGVWALHAHRLHEDAFAPGQNKPRSWRWIRRHVIEPRRPAKFIALVRDPVAVKVSDFFMNLSKGRRKRAMAQAGPEELIAMFNKTAGQSSFQLNWFETEVEPVLGIDVFSAPFPLDLGYATYRNGPFELLVMRTELPDEKKSRIVAEFVGVSKLSIGRTNTNEQKTYAERRRAFEAALSIDPTQMAAWLSAPLMQHFFSPEERESIRSRWCKDG